MRKFFERKTAKFGLIATIGGVGAGLFGKLLDHGHVDQVVFAGQPLYMNTPAEMVMVASYAIVFIGLAALNGAMCDHAGIPMTRLGVDTM